MKMVKMNMRRMILVATTAMMTAHASASLAMSGGGVDDIPVLQRTVETRYDVFAIDDGPSPENLVQTRTTEYDTRGRITRWSLRGPDGEHRLTWTGVYLGDDQVACDHAVYWQRDHAQASHELFVRSSDGRVCDVLYASPGEKARRQMRVYFDEAGREIYQEYFAPRSQRMYSEEIFAYDADGNETGRTWQRFDGRARKATRFEILERDTFRRWTMRHVYVDDALIGIDTREIHDHRDRMTARPAASAGPVPSSPEILPIPFARGVVSTSSAGESSPSLSPDGDTLIFTRYLDDWQAQTLMVSRLVNVAWQEAEPFESLPVLYNAAFADDGNRIIYCERDDTLPGGRIFIVDRTATGSWGSPLNLTDANGETGSYFFLRADGHVWFHREGELYRGVIRANRIEDVTPLPAPINTASGVEFSPWMSRDGNMMLFTRDIEGDSTQSGVFRARRTTTGWTPPERLPIPYGWAASITPDGEDLVYVVDDDIVRVPTALLNADRDRR